MRSWLYSVYSDSSKHYVSNPYPKKKERVVISLRMKKNEEIQRVFLRYREFGIEQLREMDGEEKDGLLYFKKEVEIRENRFHYQFYLVTEHQIFYYTQYRITDYIPDETMDFVILADYHGAEWVNGSVFYQIYPERFCNGRPELSVKDGEYFYQGFPAKAVTPWNTPAKSYEEARNVDFYGGDLYGIIDKLDYLEELGVNAIYLNPIFISPSAHKYDSLDYFKIEPHFGGEEALKQLTEEMHHRGMKLVLDISINHTSSDGIWFNKSGEFYDKSIGAYHNPQAPEREFYFFDEKNGYDAWFGVETMPKLNYASDRLRDVIYCEDNSVLKKWINAPYQIDGWRFDVADCLARNQIVDVHGEMLEEMRQHLKNLKSDVYLVAEDWADCADDLQGNRWDSTMNYYGCARPVREFVGQQDLFLSRHGELSKKRSKMTAKQLSSRITQFLGKMPGVIQHQMFNLLDSHDVARLHNDEQICMGDYEAAVIMLFTLPGATSVYYGDEIALSGGTEKVEFCRNPMDWEWQKREEAIQRYEFYHQLISLKRKSEALRDGGFQVISEEGYTFSYARFTGQELIVVIASTDDKPSEVRIPLGNYGFENAMVQEDALHKPLEYTVGEEDITVKVPPHTSFLIHFFKKDLHHV